MSFFVVKNRIHLTRGDSAEFDLTIRDRVTGSVFIPGDGDRLTFTLKRFITDKDPVLTKTLGQGICQEQDSCVLVFLSGRAFRRPSPAPHPAFTRWISASASSAQSSSG